MKKGWQAFRASNLALARAYVKFYAPYFSSTLYGFIPTPMPGLTKLAGGPMGITERLVLLFEPDWVESVSMIVLATGLAHECLHDQLRHGMRGKAYPDRYRWNKAADLFINGSMRTQMKTVKRPDPNRRGTVISSKEPMWEFPSWALMPEKYGFPEGLSADEYYRLLEDYDKKHPQQGPTVTLVSFGPSGSGDGESEGKQEHKITNGVCGGCCGGVAGNKLSSELEGKNDAQKGRSEADCRTIAKETAAAIKKHMESASGRGDMPGSWAELVEMSDEIFKVPWRAKLAAVMRYSIGRVRSGGLDYSRRRPSKRSYLRGIPLPGLISYDPELCFIIDSSLSMGSPQLSSAMRVCADVLQQTGITSAWFLEADTQQHREPVRINVQDLRSMEILGRGGTDFRKVIKYVTEEFRPKPHIVIYVTDGDGVAPSRPPRDVQFIWCIVPTQHKRIPANWGEVIELDDSVVALPPVELDDDDD